MLTSIVSLFGNRTQNAIGGSEQEERTCKTIDRTEQYQQRVSQQQRQICYKNND